MGYFQPIKQTRYEGVSKNKGKGLAEGHIYLSVTGRDIAINGLNGSVYNFSKGATRNATREE